MPYNDPINIGVTVVGSGDISSNPKDDILVPPDVTTIDIPTTNPDIQAIQKEAEEAEKAKKEAKEKAAAEAAQQVNSGNGENQPSGSGSESGEIPTDNAAPKILINGYVNHTYVKKVAPIVNDAVTKHEEYRDGNELACVEGELGLEGILDELEKVSEKKLTLMPLMLVAGDHAKNDLAGDEDSWKTLLQSKGFDIALRLEGLGAMEAVRARIVEKARQAINLSH